MLDVYEFRAKTVFFVRFLRIHPVRSVINSLAQLSGRGFPHIFYMKLLLTQLYVFWALHIYPPLTPDQPPLKGGRYV